MKKTYSNVDDELHLGNIQTTSRNVRGNQDRRLTRLESLERPCSLLLSQVAVDAANTDTLSAQKVFNAGSLLLVQAKDEDAIILSASALLVLLEDLQQAKLLILGVDNLDALGDADVGLQLDAAALGLLAAAANGDAGGLNHEGGRERLHGHGPGGGEHEGLALLARGAAAENLLDVVLEALVEHAVGLVEDDKLGAGQHDGVVGHEVLEAAGRSDNDVGAAANQRALVVLGGAAVEADALEAQQRGEGGQLLVRLHGELAGRRDNDGLGAALADGGHSLDARQRKRHGLSGARLGDTHDVAAGEGERPGGGLDRGRGLVVGKGRLLLRQQLRGRQLGKLEDRAQGGEAGLGVGDGDLVGGQEGVNVGLGQVRQDVGLDVGCVGLGGLAGDGAALGGLFLFRLFGLFFDGGGSIAGFVVLVLLLLGLLEASLLLLTGLFGGLFRRLVLVADISRRVLVLFLLLLLLGLLVLLILLLLYRRNLAIDNLGLFDGASLVALGEHMFRSGHFCIYFPGVYVNDSIPGYVDNQRRKE